MAHRIRWFTGLPIKHGGSFQFAMLVITRWYIPLIIISHPLITITNQC